MRGRIAAAGYGGGATVWATENFAVGRKSIDEIMQVWADPDHMRPAVNPAYCHVGAGVAQAADGSYYYILQAAYTSDQACGEYIPVPGDDPGTGANPEPPVSQIIIPVKIATPTPVGMVLLATPDAEGKIVHEVQPYQALFMIADSYNVKVDTILALNGLQVDWPLQISQKLLIDPGKVTPTPTPRPLSAIEQLTPASDGNYYHNVESGEYLAWIADLYDVNLAELMAWNGLTSASIIQPGQQLHLRVSPPAMATPILAVPSVSSTITPTPVTPTSAQELTTTLPSDIATADAEAQPSLSGMGALLVIVLVVTGLLVLGWAARRR